jgi:hypothetical protein
VFTPLLVTSERCTNRRWPTTQPTAATPSSALAHVAAATLNALSLRARSGAGREVLDAMSSATIEIIYGREPAKG